MTSFDKENSTPYNLNGDDASIISASSPAGKGSNTFCFSPGRAMRAGEISQIFSPTKQASGQLPCGRIVNLTITLTIESILPDDIQKNPKMQRLLVEAITKAAKLPSEYIRLKDIQAHHYEASDKVREASDVDFFITAPIHLFPEHEDPLNFVLQLLTTDPFLAATGPAVKGDSEEDFSAAVRRCKSEGYRGIGLRQSSGHRSKSIDLSARKKSRMRSGSATRPIIHVEDSSSEPLSASELMENMCPQVKSSVQVQLEPSKGCDDSPTGPPWDERKRKEREDFRLRLAAASKDTANRMKKMEWRVTNDASNLPVHFFRLKLQYTSLGLIHHF